jgi:hypothetical protein
MKKGDIVLHEGFKVEIRRGAPVRFGERRAIVKRLVDGQSYAVSLRHLTPLALDGAKAAVTLSGLYNCQVCGQEKCARPGICEDCLAPPTEEEIKSWNAEEAPRK